MPRTRAYPVPGPVRSIRSFDRLAGWTFLQAGLEIVLLGSDLDPIGSLSLPSGTVGLADADPITDTVVFDDGSGIVLQQHGDTLWRRGHVAWRSEQSGGTWLSRDNAWAVVPSADRKNGELIRMELGTGEVTATTQIGLVPAGIELVSGVEDLIGITTGSGLSARAWFLRCDQTPGELVEAPWRDRVLADIHASGQYVLTTPSNGQGPLVVHSWPGLDPVWTIETPDLPGSAWLSSAVFVGDDLVAGFDPGSRFRGECMLISRNQDMERVGGDSWPAPGGKDFWLEYDGKRLIRRKRRAIRQPGAPTLLA